MASAEEIIKLKKQRGNLKARLTFLGKFIANHFNSEGSIDKNKSDQNFVQLQLRLEKIDTVLGEFEQIQNEIETLVDDFDSELIERQQFEDEFFDVTSKAQTLLNNHNDCQNVDLESDGASRAGSGGSGGRSNNAQDLVNMNSNVRLPQIPLPKFSGEYQTWMEFRDTFQSLVHSDSRIPEIQKFHYLRASLEGSAKQIIESLEFSSINYSIAWDLLCQRFNNTRLLVHNHIKSINDITPIAFESASELRKLIDTVGKHLRALEALNQPVQHWDTLLLYNLSGKLDKVTVREWEKYKGKNELPTLDDFKEFLRSRADLLETLDLNETISKPKGKDNFHPKSKSFTTANVTSKCEFCQGTHTVSKCVRFLALSISDRIAKMKSLRHCLNCLKPNHSSFNCTSSSCRLCGKRHHTLLHLHASSSDSCKKNTPSDVNKVETKNDLDTTLTLASRSTPNTNPCEVLLSTAIIYVKDFFGKYQACRALLDSGSMSNFVSASTCDRLGIEKQKFNISIVGIGQSSSKVNEKCLINIKSCCENFQTMATCLVIPTIGDNIPMQTIDTNSFSFRVPSNIKLADPEYFKPSSIDILLGASIFWTLISTGQIKLGKALPVLQNTLLGWIISGLAPINVSVQRTLCNLSTTGIQEQLAKFWLLEEPISNKFPESDEDKACETHFVNNVRRDSSGRFVVAIPFKEPIDKLGDSQQVALKRFYLLENKLEKNAQFKQEYHKFMFDFEKAGYMSPLKNTDEVISYYLCHHGVINANSTTTRLRVVFDGSCPSDSGFSLNQLQFVGPQLQDDLWSILIRFRAYRVVISADISKMFLQIFVKESQRNLLRILWRYNPADELVTYTLNTVTFGLTSSPFLAVRCLKQLALESAESHPRSSQIISNGFYMDDLLSGANSETEAKEICRDVSNILKSAGFELRKWNSNSESGLNFMMKLNSGDSSNIKEFGEQSQSKTLGLYWDSREDMLMFKVGNLEPRFVSKRSILSDIAQIFDPLGLASPCIIIAKSLLQGLWLEKLSWDDEIPPALKTLWLHFREELPLLNSLTIPRHVLCNDPVFRELHGFADASLKAYGCAVYVRSVSPAGQIHVNLLCSKSKVAPIKALTVPKLELCGALVLAQLVNKVLSSFEFEFENVFLWLDSTVALSWIRSPANQYQIFVANRISQIQSLTAPDQWHYIKTDENPADLVSRGVFPSKLISNSLWFHGPKWLEKTRESWPEEKLLLQDPLPEKRKVVAYVSTTDCEAFTEFQRFSSFNKLKRVCAYCLRFLYNIRNKTHPFEGPLLPNELEQATSCLVKIIQRESFLTEITLLKQGKRLPKNSNLQKLNPFLDLEGILRVGGRLQLSNIPYSQKHPMLLSSKHFITKLLFHEEHLRLGHAGPKLLLSSIRESYWPISGTNLSKQTVRSCVKCFRAKPVVITPLMGQLPATRVIPQPPFFTTGCDYAGPILLKQKQGRGGTEIKAYVSVFVCFTTRAIHLELVTSLTSEAFISMFRRFTSRRGKPQRVFSDNGKNFVGAQPELAELGKFLENNESHLKESFSNEGVQWSFIPVQAPHFGGLWEAGVKAFKFHLKRILPVNIKLTFEEMTTVLTQIEAILNSRPLVPLSSDPSDFDALTPAHFLIGRRLTSLPDPNLMDINENRLSRYQKVQQIQQVFWQRWSTEYLQELQHRVKWKTNHQTLKLNTLVLVKDDQAPPLAWKLGRIIIIHPGPDNVARVATIRTAGGLIKRAFSKLCPLPIEPEEQDNLCVPGVHSSEN